jgi:hypothetical protein
MRFIFLIGLFLFSFVCLGQNPPAEPDYKSCNQSVSTVDKMKFWSDEAVKKCRANLYANFEKSKHEYMLLINEQMTEHCDEFQKKRTRVGPGRQKFCETEDDNCRKLGAVCNELIDVYSKAREGVFGSSQMTMLKKIAPPESIRKQISVEAMYGGKCPNPVPSSLSTMSIAWREFLDSCRNGNGGQ